MGLLRAEAGENNGNASLGNIFLPSSCLTKLFPRLLLSRFLPNGASPPDAIHCSDQLFHLQANHSANCSVHVSSGLRRSGRPVILRGGTTGCIRNKPDFFPGRVLRLLWRPGQLDIYGLDQSLSQEAADEQPAVAVQSSAYWCCDFTLYGAICRHFPSVDGSQLWQVDDGLYGS